MAALADVHSAVTGEVVAQTGSQGLDFAAMLDHARKVGGPALRKLTFHERAWMLKALANAVMARKEELYELSYATGATRTDGWIDIEGGAGTLFSFSSKGRRELPNGRVLIDGAMEPLVEERHASSASTSSPRCRASPSTSTRSTSRSGACWRSSARPCSRACRRSSSRRSSTGYLTELAVRIMIEADVLPKGALQLIMGSTGDLIDHLTCQDVVSFTGSAATAMKLQTHPVIARESVRFVAERDSLNASILGPDAAPGTPEFDLFVKEVAREMTVKAGQKCTAIRRAMAPAQHLDAVAGGAVRAARQGAGSAIRARRACRWARSPAAASSMSVREAVDELAKSARIVSGDPDVSPVAGNGAFISPILLRSDDPWGAPAVHDVEAFGPVSTLMPYKDLDDAIALANRGMGSLALVALHLRHADRRGFRARRRRLSRPHGHPRPRPAPRNRPATARPCPSSSMAAPAAPAAARRWAACAA